MTNFKEWVAIFYDDEGVVVGEEYIEASGYEQAERKAKELLYGNYHSYELVPMTSFA